MNITDYLLTPEQEAWFFNHGMPQGEPGTTTFEMAFDWAEEKWGFKIKPTDGFMGKQLYSYFISKNTINVTPTEYRVFFETKREARLACVDAIINYVDKLKP